MTEDHQIKDIQKISPRSLLSWRRFDLCAKHIYARYYGDKVRTGYGRELYCAHIEALNFARERQHGEQAAKNGVAEFMQIYDSLLGAFADKYFSPPAITLSKTGELRDGAHRVAAAIYHRRDLPAWQERSDESVMSKPRNYQWFQSRQLEEEYLDFMALEYVAMKENTFVALVFPAAQVELAAVRDILYKRGWIIYEKTIPTHGEYFPANVIRQVYVNEDWAAPYSGSFTHVHKNTISRFTEKGSLHVFLLEYDFVEDIKRAEEDIRALCGIGNAAIHITDSYVETLRLAEIFFNNNSIDLIRHANPFLSEPLVERIRKYASAIDKKRDRFCVHGGAVMEAFGLREARALDYITTSRGSDLELADSGIFLAPDDLRLAGIEADDIIYNPRNHFYYCGVKFASLATLAKIKSARRKPKDVEDLRLIRGFNQHHFSPITAIRRFRPHFPRYRRKILKRKIKEKVRRVFCIGGTLLR